MEYIFQCYDISIKQSFKKRLDINMNDRLKDISKKYFENKPLGLAYKKPSSIVLSLDYIMNDRMEFLWDLSIVDASFKDISQCYPRVSDDLIFLVNLDGIGCASGQWWSLEFLNKLNEFYKENPLIIDTIKLTISYVGGNLLIKLLNKVKKYLLMLKCRKESSYTCSIESRNLWRLEDLKRATQCEEMEVLLFIMYYLGYSYDKESELFEKSEKGTR